MKEEKTGKIYSISKLFKSITFSELWKKQKEEEKTSTLYDFYREITANLEGFEEMLVVTLLLGRTDCHAANYGMVKKEEDNYFAVTFDYGTAAEDLPNIGKLLTDQHHSYERIVSKKFLNACKKVLEKFEENHDVIVEELLKGIEAAEAVFNWWEVSTANDVMRIFANNKRQLEHLCYHIKAELAVSEHNPKKFEKYIGKIDPAYRFPVLSTQRRNFRLPNHRVNNSEIVHNPTFNHFINEGYSRVIGCHYDFYYEQGNEENALYLVKGADGIIDLHRGREILYTIKSEFNQKQLENKNEFFECDPELSKQIISIFNCPWEKPLEIRNALNTICQKYGIK